MEEVNEAGGSGNQSRKKGEEKGEQPISQVSWQIP